MQNNHNEHVDMGMIMIETNLDDMPGEWMGFVLEELFKLGVKDAFYTPIWMKKNRPAQKLSVLIVEEDLDLISSFLFKETTTLGLRHYQVTCHRLEREFVSVDIEEWGTVQLKVGKQGGKILQLAPEYEDCAKIARETGIPLRAVYDTVRAKALDQYPLLKN
jgi:uncharacterized protein (DUF111 family)